MRSPPAQPAAPAGGPKQRWRIAFSRSGATATAGHRDVADQWTAALSLVLPLARSETARPRPALTFAATLPPGMAAQRELADVVLGERLPAWRVRDAVRSAAPAGIAVDDVFDVWVGATAIAADVAAADYVVVLSGAIDLNGLRGAVAALLAANRLERQRARGDRVTSYDLRPLVASIEVLAGSPLTMRVRTRFHPERGAGRPEEVVAAIAELAGQGVDVTEITRERVLLNGDLV